jgi:hypothetical protein
MRRCKELKAMHRLPYRHDKKPHYWKDVTIKHSIKKLLLSKRLAIKIFLKQRWVGIVQVTNSMVKVLKESYECQE